MATEKETLLRALDQLIETYSRSRINIVGQSIRVDGSNAPPGSSIVGQSIFVQGGGGGSVVGQRIVIDGSSTQAAVAQRDALLQELRDATAAIATGSATKSWVTGLLGRIQPYADTALQTALTTAVAAATTYFLPK